MTPRLRTLLAALVGLALAGSMVAITWTVPAWQEPGVGGADDVDQLVFKLFREHAVALLVLGVLLTAAMIGALVIARPIAAPLDSIHYPAVPDDVLDETQRRTELERDLAAGDNPAGAAPRTEGSP